MEMLELKNYRNLKKQHFSLFSWAEFQSKTCTAEFESKIGRTICPKMVEYHLELPKSEQISQKSIIFKRKVSAYFSRKLTVRIMVVLTKIGGTGITV
jgi:hypothetical protein